MTWEMFHQEDKFYMLSMYLNIVEECEAVGEFGIEIVIET